MPSVLDRRIQEAVGRITGPEGRLPLTSFERDGQTLPLIAAAPPALSHYFAHFCALHAEKDFLVAGEERLSFAAVHAAAQDVAGALVGRFGVARGDRVGIAMRNCPSWIVCYMGVLMAGGVATLLNGWWQGNELAEGIASTGTRLVLADPLRTERLAAHADAHGASVIPLDVNQPSGAAIAPLVEGGTKGELPQLSGDDLATT